MKRCILLVLLLAIAVTDVKAQRIAEEYGFSSIRSSPLAVRLAGEPPRAAIGLLGDGSKDHRYAGMYVGLGLGAVLIAANLAHCDNPDSGCDSGRTMARAPIALVFLGGVGALVGRAFPKTSATPPGNVNP